MAANRVGQQLGNYRLTSLLGEGGFAEVYLGEHIHLGTLGAIKVLSAKLQSEEIEHFREEARTIARLKHPAIVRVLDFGVEGEVPFLVMDYAPNGTLRQRHPKGTRLPLAVIVPYVRQITSALQFAHERKLIHRDVKPENMLVGEQGEVLLSDFGIAVVSQSSRYQSTQDVVGTIAYMAPEQIQAHPRPASDQYALGIVIYEWLTGERPFIGSMPEVLAKQISVAPQSLRERLPDLSPAVEQVLMTALEKDPKARFGSVQAFANAFEQASLLDLPTQIAHSSIPFTPPPAPIRTATSAPPTTEQSLATTAESPNPAPAAAELPPTVIAPPAAPPERRASGMLPPTERVSHSVAPSPSGSVHPSAEMTVQDKTSGEPPTTRSEAPVIPGSDISDLYRRDRAKARARRSRIIVVSAILIVVLVGGAGLAFVLASHPHTTQTNTQPTDTPIPTFTPTVTPNPLAPYTASVPGPGATCDHGNGQWSVSDSQNTTVSCSATGMTLAQPAGAKSLAEVFFSGPRRGYAFPSNYSVSIDVSNLSAQGCIGILTRIQTGGSLGGYGFFVCANGTWYINRYDNATGIPTTITSAFVSAASFYHLEVVANGASQSITFNGGSPHTINDSTYQTTGFLALAAYGQGSNGGSATFSNFNYTPMP